MSVTLTPRAPVAFHLFRLRQSIAGPAQDSKFSDAELISFLSEGYRSLCERSTILRAKTLIPTIDGQQEYPLPADVNRVLEVYLAGRRLAPLPLRIAPRDDQGGFFYEYEGRIGISQTPQGSGSFLVYYVQTPPVLTLSSVPAIGAEWYYLLHHYAAHKVLLLVGGERYVKKAQWHRAQFELGCRLVRRQVGQDTSRGPRMIAAVEVLGGAG